MHKKAGMLLGYGEEEKAKLLNDGKTREGFLQKRRGCICCLLWLLLVLVGLAGFYAYTRKHTTAGGAAAPSASPSATPPAASSSGASSSAPFQIIKQVTVGDASKDGFARTDYNLVFSEDFNSDTSLHSGLWNVQRTMDGGGNGQFQYYTDNAANLYINTTDGSLRIKPGLFQDMPAINGVSAYDVMVGNCTDYPECATFKVPNCTSTFGCEGTGYSLDPLMPTTSARIDSQANFEFQYGRLEFRARMARGDWLWPGLWMMPHESLFGGWPDDGEIDIIETRGNAPGFLKSNQSAGRDVLLSTLHYMGNVFWKAQGHGLGVDWTEDYHTFGLYWSDEEMYTYYLDADGQEVLMIDLSAAKGGYANGFAAPPLGYDNTTDPHNPENYELTGIHPHVYDGHAKSAPFDQPFYLIFNLAVGGAQNGCPNPDYFGTDAVWCTICEPNCGQPTFEFLKAKDEWYPTWEEADKSDKLSLAIDWIKVWQ